MTASLRRVIRTGGGAAAALLIVVAGLLAGTGWLYALRGLRWLDVGPRIDDALPLLQLASFDGQPLLRVLLAWVLAGALTGVALSALSPSRRAALALVMALVVLLLVAQEAYDLTRNLDFSGTVFSHSPGVGPALEAAAFAFGCWLPRRTAGGEGPRPRRRSLIPVTRRYSADRGMGGRQRGHGGEHDRNREPVRQPRGHVRA